MGFLQPLALFGLVAAAIPALLHLMTRRQPPEVSFPAVRYIRETERVHSRRLKLRNLLLLVLRTLLIVFAVLAASRPILTLGAGRSHEPTAVGLVVDNSLSSGLVLDGRSVLDMIRERAQVVLDRLGSDDRLWLVLAEGVPQPIGRIDAATILDTVSVQPTRLDLGDAARAVGTALAGSGLPRSEIVVLSDLQRTAVSAGEPPDSRVVFWQSPPPPENHGIDSVVTVERRWGEEGSLVAWVGGAGTDPVAARLTLAGLPGSQTVVRPGEQVTFPTRTSRAGWLLGEISLDPDELRADDRTFAAVHQQPPAATAVVSPVGPFLDQALTVLREAGRIGDGNGVTVGDVARGARGIVIPPQDPALVGATNRSLAQAGSRLRFGDRLDGDWLVSGEVDPVVGATVSRRQEIRGGGEILARAGSAPWLVRDGELLLLGSRMDYDWTDLPVGAGFIPFIDLAVNVLAAPASRIIRVPAGAAFEVPPGVSTLVRDSLRIGVRPATTTAAPADPGVYFLVADGGDTLGAMTVSHDPRESRLEQASAAMLTAAFGPGVVVPTDDFATALFGGGGRLDLTATLVALALVVALVELWVATGGAGRRARAQS